MRLGTGGARDIQALKWDHRACIAISDSRYNWTCGLSLHRSVKKIIPAVSTVAARALGTETFRAGDAATLPTAAFASVDGV